MDIQNKDKPEITRLVKEGDKIILLEARKKVSLSGNSGHIILPKELIGEIVKITYKKS